MKDVTIIFNHYGEFGLFHIPLAILERLRSGEEHVPLTTVEDRGNVIKTETWGFHPETKELSFVETTLDITTPSDPKVWGCTTVFKAYWLDVHVFNAYPEDIGRITCNMQEWILDQDLKINQIAYKVSVTPFGK
jgi:hypothetical protein